MNDQRIQEVIEIEKQADDVYNKAISEAARIPLQAEQQAKEMIAKARAEAEKQASIILASAEAKDQCDQILAEAEENITRTQKLSKQNFNRAVTYVVARVLGRE